MIKNKSTTFHHSESIQEINVEDLPFDLKTPPQTIVHNIPLAINIYSYKFANCIHCVKKEEKSSGCGSCNGKKIVAKCDKLNIDNLVAGKCLFCSEFDHSITVNASDCDSDDTGSTPVGQPSNT